MSEERISKLIMDWIPRERRKGGRPRNTWTEGVQAAKTTRNLEPDQRRNREELRLFSGRWRQLLKNRTDGQAGGQAGWQAGRQEGGRAGRRAGGRAGGRAGRQTDRRTDRQTDGRTDRRTDRQTDGRAERKTDRQTDR